MAVANIITFVLLLVGGLNWGLVGIFDFNLVEWICGGKNAVARIIYVLVLLSAIWLVISACINGSVVL